MADDRTFEIGFVMAGAISAGAYTAGVMDFIFEALDAYEQDLTIAKRLAEQDKSNWDRQRDLAISYQKVGDVFRAQGKLDQAIAHYTKAVQLDPDDSDAYFGRAFANQIIANFRGALRDFVRYLPTSANAWRRNRQM